MDFAEKLAQLTEGKNKQQLSTRAGLTPTAISNYISKGTVPGPSNALALARVLNVPLEWLVDDKQELPPPEMGDATGIQFLPDDELMREVSRRFHLETLDLWRRLKRMREIDWKRVAKSLLVAPLDAPIPKHVASEAGLPDSLQAAPFNLQKYDASFAVHQYKHDLPGAEIKPEELEPDALLAQCRQLIQDPGIRLVEDYLALRMSKRGGFEDDREAQQSLKALQAELDRLTQQDARKKPAKKQR